MLVGTVESVSTDGWLTVPQAVAVQPFASVTVTQYGPAGPLLMFGGDYPHSEGEPSLDAYRAKAGPIDPAMTNTFFGGNMEFLLGNR